MKKENKKETDKHPHQKIENPDTGKITEGEIGSLDKNSAAQNPERQEKERKAKGI